MITIYEQLKRAKKGEVIYTERPARNVTSAASRTGRRVETEKCFVYSARSYGTNGRDPRTVLRVRVIS